MIQLCLILDDLKERRSYRQQAITYLERAKSRTFTEALGPTIQVSPPVALQPELLQTEMKLVEKLQALRAKMQTSPSDESIQREYGNVQDELNALWEKIALSAPEYAALRRGMFVTFEEISLLIAL
jgi:hypothetical protein